MNTLYNFITLNYPNIFRDIIHAIENMWLNSKERTTFCSLRYQLFQSTWYLLRLTQWILRLYRKQATFTSLLSSSRH